MLGGRGWWRRLGGERMVVEEEVRCYEEGDGGGG